jgi:hypothetical protein
MKFYALLLSLGSLVGTIGTVVDSSSTAAPKPQVVFSENATLSIPSASPPDYQRTVEEALSDGQNRDIALSDLVRTQEDQ